jgi:hypothetical protein
MLRLSIPSLSVVLILHGSALAQPTTLELRLSVLKDVADALVAAGNAIKSITDGIAHMMHTGALGYSHVSAARERARMIDISARASRLAQTQNKMVVQSLDDFLAAPTPTESDWRVVRLNVSGTLKDVESLLNDVRAERSDLVLEKSYQQLLETLGARAAILDRLMKLPLPSSAEERAALTRVNDAYKKLIAELREAIGQLNEYIKTRGG